jgi:hypothetical protein
LLALLLLFGACSVLNKSLEPTTTTTTTITTTTEATTAANTQTETESAAQANGQTSSSAATTTTTTTAPQTAQTALSYDPEDDAAEDGATVAKRITTSGTHTISGAVNGQILVLAQNVTLVLDGAVITCNNGSAILGKDGDGDASLQSLTVELRGKNTINGAKHGIAGKDELIITGSGSADITSVKDGLHAGDSLTIKGGTLNITAGSDGAECGNSDEGIGEISLAGGVVNITAGGGAGATAASTGGKGIKSGKDINISGGKFNISSVDDCVHANGSISMSNGSFVLASADDAMHADSDLTVNGGSIDVTKSYEGLEGTNISIGGGTIKIISSDDGINAAGGTNGATGGGWFGIDIFSGGDSGITISGGEVILYTASDGVDSNGTLDISGGTVAIFIDTSVSRDGDATDTESGGTIQPALYGSTSLSSGTKLAVGNIWSVTLEANVTSFCLILPGVVNGQSYTITANGATWLTTTATTTIQGMMGGGNAGGMGGRGGRPMH